MMICRMSFCTRPMFRSECSVPSVRWMNFLPWRLHQSNAFSADGLYSHAITTSGLMRVISLVRCCGTSSTLPYSSEVED